MFEDKGRLDNKCSIMRDTSSLSSRQSDTEILRKRLNIRQQLGIKSHVVKGSESIIQGFLFN